MGRCTSCGHIVEGTKAFCPKCGAHLKQQTSRTNQPEEANAKGTKSTNTKTMILLPLVTVLVIGLFIGYQFLSKKYSEEKVIEQFNVALTNKDQAKLKELIVPADSRIKVNNQSLAALFTLLDNEPSLLQDIDYSLRENEIDQNLFYLRKDGKYYGIFDRYVIDTPAFYFTIDDHDLETKIYLNDKEIGVLDGSVETKEFGPFLTGVYTIRGIHKKGKHKSEDVATVTLAGTKLKKDVSLNIKSTEEKDKVQTVLKEIVREVPTTSNNQYILPNSDYIYLTDSDLAGLSKSELKLARNEIYARHGYIFDTQYLQDYFNSRSWYRPNPSFDGTVSTIEESNANLIKKYENE